MRKISIVIILLTCISLSYGQDSNMKIGIELSGIFNAIRNNSKYYEYYQNPLLSPKVNFSYCIIPQLDLKTGLGFERREAETLDEVWDGHYWWRITSDVDFTFDYLNLPLVFSYSTKGRVKYILGGGLYFGYLFNKELYYRGFDDQEGWIDGSEYLQSFDMGISLETGVRVRFWSKYNVELGVRKDFGFINLYKHDLFNVGSMQTGSFAVYLGILYTL